MKKRFIAGAVCPKCSAMDRLVMFEQDGATVRECVECGFSDTQKDIESQTELDTRVNQVEPQPEPNPTQDNDVSPIRILH